jgi:hypothetical protein
LVKFKNELERQCFEIAERALGAGVTIEHNKTVQIEAALFPEVASFKGPPAKEVDVLVAKLLDQPKIVLLVSCKLLSRPAEPAHLQEWGAVVQTMNRYSEGTVYLGLVVSPTGFTSGCEAWATSHNVGIIPPIKGRRLVFSQDAVFRMFKRSLVALAARVRLRADDLQRPPEFFDFVYRLVADFEGHEEAKTYPRYSLLPHGFPSSFGEMYQEIAGRTVQSLQMIRGGTAVKLSGSVALEFTGTHVRFGEGPGTGPQMIQPSESQCWKNVEKEPCNLAFASSIAVGKAITSAGDFGKYLEVGLEKRFNLGLYESGFHIVSTENPIEKHRI